MSFLRRVGPPLLALIASCGGGGADDDVSDETPAVFAETRVDAAPRGTGFVVWGTADGTLVYDVANDTSFRIQGQPVPDDGAIGEWDPWMEVGFLSENVREHVVASADGNVILVRDGDAISAVDLKARSVRATFHGEATSATIAPDGSAFVAITALTKSVVDARDGSVASIASTTLGGPPLVLWRGDFVSWVDEDGAHLFDRRTHADTAIALPGAHGIDRSDRFVFWNDREVQVWTAGATKPEARVVSAHVAEVVADDDGKRVAWLEYDGEHAWMHTLDVAANVHLRFPSKAAPCSVGPERVVEIRGSEVVTDEECTTGCPSFERRPAFVAYDFASGSFSRRWDGPVSPPYNDGLSARMTEGERIANLFGHSPLRHHPSRDVVLAPASNGLRLGAVRDGSTVVAIEESEGFAAGDVVFIQDGALLVGRIAGAVAVWDGSTGRRLFHAGVSALP